MWLRIGVATPVTRSDHISKRVCTVSTVLKPIALCFQRSATLSVLSVALLLLLFSLYLPIPCPFLAILGVPCPACGLSRAFRSLGCFHFSAAWRYNPSAFMLACYLFTFVLTSAVRDQRLYHLNKYAGFGLCGSLLVFWCLNLAGFVL